MRRKLDAKYVDAHDMVARDGATSHKHWLAVMSKKVAKAGAIENVFDGRVKGEAVLARIDFERWLADCPDPQCNGAELIDLDELIFFCMSCGNIANDGAAIPVIVPGHQERVKIYAELEKRPMSRPRFANKLLRSTNSRPKLFALGRSWNPDETTDDLRRQRKQSERIAEALKNSKGVK